MTDPQYRDRCNGYVPTPLPPRDTLRPTGHVIVGRHTPASVPTRLPLALAQADELNRDHNSWWWAQVDPGSAETPEHWSWFRGHRVLVDIEVTTWNRRTVNDWKGRDEIRPHGRWLLRFNGEPVYGNDFGGDPFAALDRIQRVGKTLLDGGGPPIDWTAGNYRAQLQGRAVYYRDQPARLGFWMPDQGCIMVEADGCKFRPRAYEIESGHGDPEDRDEAKVDLLTPDIWWWRDPEAARS